MIFTEAFADDVVKVAEKVLVETIVQQPSLPIQGSDVAVAWDSLYWFLIWLSVFFFILVVGAMIYFAVKYRNRPGIKTEYITDHHALEAVWTVIPTILLMIIFVWGWVVYKDMVRPPSDAMEIRVVGKQWLWNFQYEDGKVLTNEVYVPVNKPIKFVMSSEDVLHSFFIPNFRVKQDVVPGIYTSVWFEAKIVGEHQVYCTEYCGASHSLMLAKVKVLTAEQWEAWKRGKTVLVEQLPNNGEHKPLFNNLPGSQTVSQSGAVKFESLSLPEQGQKLTESKGCIACHSSDGSQKIGPSYKGIYGHDQALADGSTVKVTDDYIRESILKPQAKVVKGFNPVMPPYQGMINETELNALIAYIKSLKE